MKRLLLLSLLCLPLGAAAQAPVVRYERDADNCVVFRLEGRSYPGTTTVFMKFTSLENCHAPVGTVTRHLVRSDRPRFLTLRPVDRRRPVRFAYRCRIRAMCVDPRVDTDFVYRMPCTLSRPIQCGPSYDMAGRLDPSKRRPLGYRFLLEEGDTVYAMRRGVVTRIHTPAERDVDRQMLAATTERMRIHVEHPDGTEAVYSGISAPEVEVGEQVLPGTPLARAGSDDGERYQVFVQVVAYLSDTDKPLGTEGFAELRTEPCLRLFATTDGPVRPSGKACTGTMDEALLTAELSPREAKRLKGNKK